jgi:putative phosphoribosyl transferase
MEPIFRDRREAGEQLAQALIQRGILPSITGPSGQTTAERSGFLALGIPRGGLVVAAEVARRLEIPLDVVMARKLRAPYQPELAIGAVVSGNAVRLIDEQMARATGADTEYLEREVAYQEAEIQRRLEAFRGDRPPPDVRERTVIVIDDGIATGYTFRAALEGLRRQQPQRLIAAVPVAPQSSLESLAGLPDTIACLATPEPFVAVGIWYEDFTQTTDEEVVALLQENWGRNP